MSQTDLFDAKPARQSKRTSKKGKLEMHEHCIISGPRACQTWNNRIVHSHEGGDVPHQHEITGPGSYTIDKDEWFRETGLRGGGRKRFTVTPEGEQLPIRELEDWQRSFEIIHCGPPKDHQGGEGPGIALPMRLILACKMTVAAVRNGNVQ